MRLQDYINEYNAAIASVSGLSESCSRSIWITIKWAENVGADLSDDPVKVVALMAAVEDRDLLHELVKGISEMMTEMKKMAEK